MFPKPTKIRSKKITDSAKGERCTLRISGVCNHNPETVVFAHIEGSNGMGTKNHDLFGVYACSDCHDWLDGRNYLNVNLKAKYYDILQALQETQIKLVQKGLIEVR
jgi:hypothetical protein